jgi:hypothetical protein
MSDKRSEVIFDRAANQTFINLTNVLHDILFSLLNQRTILDSSPSHHASPSAIVQNIHFMTVLFKFLVVCIKK